VDERQKPRARLCALGDEAGRGAPDGEERFLHGVFGNDEAARAWKERALRVNAYALAAFGPLEAHRR